jgi:ligand-binding sensor domain-containing protein
MDAATRITYHVACVAALFTVTIHPHLQAAQAPSPDQFAGHQLLRVITKARLNSEMILADNPGVIYQDSTGLFWVGSEYGCYCYDEKHDRWVDHSHPFGKHSLSSIYTIGEDKLGRIWVLYGFGTHHFAFFDGDRWRDGSSVLPSRISSLGEVLITGNDRELWFAAPEGLIGYDGREWNGPFNPSRQVIEFYAQLKTGPPYQDRGRLPEDKSVQTRWASYVSCGQGSRDGSVWLGADNVIWKFEPRTADWNVYATNGLKEGVSRIAEDPNGRLWLTDDYGGLVVSDQGNSKKTWTSYDLAVPFSGPAPAIDAIYFDRQHQVMIGTEAGIVLLDLRTNRLSPIAAFVSGFQIHSVRCITKDNNGRIWVGSRNGILILKD